MSSSYDIHDISDISGLRRKSINTHIIHNMCSLVDLSRVAEVGTLNEAKTEEYTFCERSTGFPSLTRDPRLGPPRLGRNRKLLPVVPPPGHDQWSS